MRLLFAVMCPACLGTREGDTWLDIYNFCALGKCLVCKDGMIRILNENKKILQEKDMYSSVVSYYNCGSYATNLSVYGSVPN